jgi:hypothetical protein
MQPPVSIPIFIGGTGRSGTTILKRILARHSKVFALKSEGRIIADPDGLIDVADALSTRYYGAGSDKPLRRFADMMRRIRKVHPAYRVVRRLSRYARRDLFELFSPDEYGAYEIGRELNLEHFDRTVANFFDDIEACQFRGIWPGARAFRFRPKMRHAKRYTRDEALEKCGQLMHTLFSYRLVEQQKTHWIEDTPGNLIRSAQIYEMFPEMKFVHAFRDPRDVAASYVKQRWAPSDPATAVWTMAVHLEAWMETRDGIPAESVFSLKFEDLIASPDDMLRRLCDFLELPFEDVLLDIDLSRHNIGRYKKQLTPEVIGLTERMLAPWMSENGYEPTKSRPVAVERGEAVHQA